MTRKIVREVGVVLIETGVLLILFAAFGVPHRFERLTSNDLTVAVEQDDKLRGAFNGEMRRWQSAFLVQRTVP